MFEAECKVQEERKLRHCEENGGPGDEVLEWESGGEKVSGLVGNPGELGVVAGLAFEAGDMHREEGGVSADEGSPEVDAAEGLGHEAPRSRGSGCDLREPVVGGGEEAEDSGHGHDEVEVSDNEEGVVKVLIQDWLSEDGAGEASGDKEGDEAEGEEHRGLVLGTAAPDGGEPAENFGSGGDGNGHGADREGGPGEGVKTGYEHVVSPDEDAKEADEQSSEDHDAVAEDLSAAEVAKNHGGEAHAGKDGDVDLWMSEEPEEMQPEERASIPGAMAWIMQNSVGEVAGGDEEAGAGVTVTEEKKQCG